MFMKVVKDFLSSIFMLIMLISSSISSIFAMDTNQKNISDFLYDYFDCVEKAKGSLNLDKSKVLDYFETKNNYEIIYLDTLIKHRQLQISDLKYNNFKNVIQINSIEKDGNKIVVDLVKETTIYYNCLDGEESIEEELHTISLINQENQFKIVTDNHYDEFKEELGLNKEKSISLIKENAKEMLLNEEKIVRMQKQELEALKEDFKLKKDESFIINDNGLIGKDMSDFSSKQGVVAKAASSFTKHAYNRTEAKDYAIKYVLSPNKSYVNFESMGGNCTNFTSQCLKAGGIVQDKTGNYKWYYTSSSDRAPAWTSANNFRNYYRNNKGSKTVKGLNASSCQFSTTRLGDLAQVVNNGKASHTMFISGAICDNWVGSTTNESAWKYKYDVRICQNSVSKSGRQKNVPLSSKYSLSKLEYIHINGSYY